MSGRGGDGRSGGRPRRRRRVVIAATVALLLGLSTAIGVGVSGITAPGDSSAPAPAASPSPTGELAASTLVPVSPDPYTVEAVGAETTRVADLMVGFIDAGEGGLGNLLNDDAVAQVVPAGGGAASYYGVIRTLTLDPSVDATAQATSLQSALVAGGWILRDVSDAGSASVATLSSSAEPVESWFLQIGVDRSVPGESVISLQLASPDLP